MASSFSHFIFIFDSSFLILCSQIHSYVSFARAYANDGSERIFKANTLSLKTKTSD